MRVANIIEEARLGGPQHRMVRVAAALRDQVFTTIVMPREHSGPFREECEAHGIDCTVRPITRITKDWRVALRYLLLSPFEILGLRRFLRRRRFDLVHASGGSWQYKAVCAARLAGIPVVWHLNDTNMPALFRRLFAVLGRFADGFIFASHRSREYYQPLLTYSRPDCVIPAPVNADWFDPEGSYAGDDRDSALIESWAGQTVIGTVANVNPVKGLETLIRAARLLDRSQAEIRFVVVGLIHANQKVHHLRLEALKSELGVGNVEFVGGRRDVRPLLSRFDIYVCSSVAESSPVSVWEAMAMARPIVSTDVGDVPRHVRDGETGFIVPVGDHAALADRCARLIADPGLRARFGAASRDAARTEFAPERIARLTANFYSRVVSSRKGASPADAPDHRAGTEGFVNSDFPASRRSAGERSD